MTAEVKILVGELKTSWSCRSRPSPSTRGSSTPSSRSPRAIKRQEGQDRRDNEKQVQILDGLTEGERVALDARMRAAAEFKRRGEERRRTEAAQPDPAPETAVASRSSRPTRPIGTRPDRDGRDPP